MKVLISPSSFADKDKTPINILKKAGFEIIDNPYKRRLTKMEVVKLLSKDIEYLIAGLEPLDRGVLEKSSLKVLSRCGSGLSNVDLIAAKDLGIKVCSTPDAPVDSVAELTLCAMLNLLRNFSQMNSNLHNANWSKQVGNQLKEKTVVIIGFGRIGRRLANLLKPFNVKIIAVDNNKNTLEGVHSMSLKKALSYADIISIHASGESCVIGEREFTYMKKGTFILNAARGALVDEKALAGAIEKGVVKGAWLDAFIKEPYKGILIKYPQVLLTPHVGSYSFECRRTMEIQAVENLINNAK
jgi:D-3-phosphoglycerate dehydrogenase